VQLEDGFPVFEIELREGMEAETGFKNERT
jgi:hypothetical protein